MSIAPRKCLTSWKFWPGQPRRLGQIVQTESSGLTVGVPQIGHFFGGRALRSRLPSRRWISGAITCGITSPARVTTTSSRSRTSFFARSSSLCRVAVETVTPPTWTGSSIANGSSRPVRPDVPDDPVERRRRGDRRELPGHRPARLAAGDAELAPQRALVDLDHDAVDLEVERLAPLLPPQAALDHVVDVLVLGDVAVDRESRARASTRAPRSGSRTRSRDGRRSRSSTSTAAATRSPRRRGCGPCPRSRCAGWRRSPGPRTRAAR